MRLLEAYSKIVRAEYLKGELPAVAVPALLTATSFGGLGAITVIESIACFSLLYVTGFMINAVTDRETDLTYGSFKRQIGEAATVIGDRRIFALIVAHIAVGLALATDVALRIGNPWLVVLVLLGVFLGLAYSAPPFSLKTRGIAAHAVSLSLAAFTIPFLFLYIAARGSLDLPGLVVVGAFSVTGYSLEYANQAYDFTEDLAAGIATPAIRLGLRRSIRIAFAAFAISLPILAFSLAYLALSRPSVALALGESARPLVVLGAVAAVGGGYFIALRGMARIVRAARAQEHDSAELVEKIRSECNYSLWQTAGVAGLGAFALAVFLLTVSTTSALEGAAQGGLAFEGTPVSSPYVSAGLQVTDVSGTVHADVGTGALPRAGLVRVELFGQGEAHPYATLWVAVTLPTPGTSVDFEARALPLRAGATARLTLLVDADFDGRADSPAATVEFALPMP